MIKKLLLKFSFAITSAVMLAGVLGVGASTAYAACPGGAKYCCGSGQNAVVTSIDLGCSQNGNPILDLLFAVIRLLSDGVGIVVIGSIIVAGIQYSASRGDPQTSAKAMGRISSSLVALLVYIFAYAILNYVIPGQFLH